MKTQFLRSRIPDPFTAEELAAGGISVATDSANMKHDGWADRAAVLFDEYLKTQESPFMAEDFRKYAEANGLECPPSNRAYGGVIRHASTDKKIRWYSYGKTSNPKAHGTPASLWVRA